ncbi:putative quinol monooxygenase [Streptomyces olivochromogenes]|uniref:putative quinol monooxygenase n=1 Tax=Streptomyces olivochromogenes TaxID=1963 RepID=UPI0036D8E52D
MAIAISATWTAHPGKEGVVRDALAKLVPATRAEPGCQAYVVHQDPEQPTVFRFFEIYDDEDALKAHGDYPHFTKYAVGQAAPALADRSHEFTTVLDF